jgi:hypothetical protein
MNGNHTCIIRNIKQNMPRMNIQISNPFVIAMNQSILKTKTILNMQNGRMPKKMKVNIRINIKFNTRINTRNNIQFNSKINTRNNILGMTMEKDTNKRKLIPENIQTSVFQEATNYIN